MSAGAIAAIAIVAWVIVLVFVWALMRMAALGDEAMARSDERERIARVGNPEPAAAQGGVLAQLIDLAFRHDPAMGRHAGAVAHYARELAAAAKLPAAQQALAHTVGLLHGLGEPSFFDAVLAGEHDLLPAAREITARHAALGVRVLDEMPGMAAVADIIETCSEHVDGSGRPYGLRGDEIPRGARIVAVADAYETYVAVDRSRGVASGPRAAEGLREAAGRRLDARLVEVFLTSVVGRRVGEPAPFQPSVAHVFHAFRHADPRSHQ